VTNNELDDCLQRAARALLARRCQAGYWEGRLSSSPLATAVALCALADEPTANADLDKGLAWLQARQNPDGGWNDAELDRSNPASTILALAADSMFRRLRGPDAAFLSKKRRKAAEQYLNAVGGLDEGLRNIYGTDLTFQAPLRLAAACAGNAPWSSVNALPFEAAALPPAFWRLTGLPVVGYAIPALVCVGLARHANAPSAFLPLRWLRSWATEATLKKVRAAQPESGGFLEAVPITAFCLLGLKAAGRAEHPLARDARRFLAATQRPDGSWPVEVHLSVWNTTRAVEALATAGLLPSALSEAEQAATRDWLLHQQTRAVSPYSGAPAGGWGWNHLSGSVPDADDTAGAILALRRLGLPANHPALQKAAQWLRGLQNRDGGWPTFNRGLQKLPFDRSAPDLTAHALRALLDLGEEQSPAVEAGWRYLAHAQRADGSYAPLWFGSEKAAAEKKTKARPNLVYGAAQAVAAFAAAGQNMKIAQTLPFFHAVQNSDGGCGGQPGLPTTAEDTGLALRALAAAESRAAQPLCERMAQCLQKLQRSDGTWNAAPIGLYFAVLWYYEELYPLCFALNGLGAWRSKTTR
jgi:squalene-hopene/tetraprenyl-beta-curcumene cyclase